MDLSLPGVVLSRLPSVVSDDPPWPRFGDGQLPPGRFVEHKPAQRVVDLTFDRVPLAVLRGALPAELQKDAVSTGASSALRRAVPPIDHLRPFGEQIEAVRAVLATVEQLLTVGNKVPPTPRG